MKPRLVSRYFTPFLLVVTALVLVGGATPRAAGDVVAFDWAGRIDTTHDAGFSLHSLFGDLELLIGQPISGSFGYDTAAANLEFALASPYLSPETVVGAYLGGPDPGPPGNFASISLAGQTGRAVASGWPPGFIITVVDNDFRPVSSEPTDAITFTLSHVRFVPDSALNPQAISPLLTEPDEPLFWLTFAGLPSLFSGYDLPENLNLVDYRGSGTLASTVGDRAHFNITSLTKRDGPGHVPDCGSTILLLLVTLPAMSLMRRISCAPDAATFGSSERFIFSPNRPGSS